MSSERFEFYADELLKLIGKPGIGKRLLDYGCGNGELAERLQAHGYSVEAAEFSTNFQKNIEDKKLTFVHALNIPSERYDIIIANNCLFYTHPKKLNIEIFRLLYSLRPDGVLWITDSPTKEKINFLTTSKFQRALFKLTGVYQAGIGGFFLDSKMLAIRFNAQLIDSWTPYRSHFKILKKQNQSLSK